LFQPFEHFERPLRLQLGQVDTERRAHDAAADQQHVDRAVRLVGTELAAEYNGGAAHDGCGADGCAEEFAAGETLALGRRCGSVGMFLSHGMGPSRIIECGGQPAIGDGAHAS
jgi:hypothetical protein